MKNEVRGLFVAFIAVFLSLFLPIGSTGGICAAFDGKAEFMVMSDPHFYDRDLGIDGVAFEIALATEPKLLRESEAILNAFIEKALAAFPDFVLVPGDLTKDGAKKCHEKFADQLARLESAGIGVYVVPGNHDVENPHAFSYGPFGAMPVETVSAEEFAVIYSSYGFDEAIERDPNSLSYLAEPVPGLWLLGLDSCNYNQNETYPVTGGSFSPDTLNWILDKLYAASQKGKTVLAMMHHNLLEHFQGQSEAEIIGSDYVVENWEHVSKSFHRAGLHLVFTGHHHAQDVTAAYYSEGNETRPLFDVMTASLSTYPCSFRTVSMHGTTVDIGTSAITEIDYDTEGLPFQEYAKRKLTNWLYDSAREIIQSHYGVTSELAETILPMASDALVAYYLGDESPSFKVLATIMALSSGSDSSEMARLFKAVWTDLPPADNHLSINIHAVDVVPSRELIFPLIEVDEKKNTDTEICIVNGKDGESAIGRFNGYSRDGEIVGQSEWIELPPNGRASFSAGELFLHASSVSYVAFESDSDVGDLHGSSRTTMEDSRRGSIQATRDAASGAIPIPHIASSENWITRIRVVNSTDKTKDLRYEFDNGESVDISLPPRGANSSSIRELFGGSPRPAIGSGMIRNAAGVIALCEYRSAGSGPYGYWEVIKLDDALPVTSYIPRLRNDGSEITGLSIYNPLEKTSKITITSYDENGNALSEKTASIHAGDKYIGIVESLGFPANAAWCRVEATVGVSGMELCASRDGKGMSGFSAQRSPRTRGLIPFLEKNGGRTLIGIVNVGEKTNTVTLTGRDHNGEEKIEGALVLKPFHSVENRLDGLLTSDCLTPELLDSLAYVSFAASEPVIGYQINISGDAMSVDGFVVSVP